MIACMVFYMSDTCRERARALLHASTRPLTVAAIAAQLGTSTNRAGIVLRELERQGAATRERGGSTQAGRLPDWWTAARP